jgi:hypothetical protein
MRNIAGTRRNVHGIVMPVAAVRFSHVQYFWYLKVNGIYKKFHSKAIITLFFQVLTHFFIQLNIY